MVDIIDSVYPLGTNRFVPRSRIQCYIQIPETLSDRELEKQMRAVFDRVRLGNMQSWDYRE